MILQDENESITGMNLLIANVTAVLYASKKLFNDNERVDTCPWLGFASKCVRWHHGIVAVRLGFEIS